MLVKATVLRRRFGESDGWVAEGCKDKRTGERRVGRRASWRRPLAGESRGRDPAAGRAAVMDRRPGAAACRGAPSPEGACVDSAGRSLAGRQGRRAGRRAWRGRSQRTVPPAAQTGHVSLKGGGRCLVTCSALRPRTRGRGSGDVTGQRPTAGPERPGQGRGQHC